MIKVAALFMSFAHVFLHLSPQTEKKRMSNSIRQRCRQLVQAWSPSADETELKEEGVVEWNEWR